MQATELFEKDGYVTFQMSPPYLGYDHILVYGTMTRDGPRVMAWPSNQYGAMMDHFELPCSVEGTIAVTAAIAKAGYQLKF